MITVDDSRPRPWEGLDELRELREEHPVALTDDERLTRGQQMGGQYQRVAETELETKRKVRELKDHLAEEQAELKRLAKIVREGKEPRSVVCMEYADYHKGLVYVVREDTFECVRTRSMKDEERQTWLKGIQDGERARLEREELESANRNLGSEAATASSAKRHDQAAAAAHDDTLGDETPEQVAARAKLQADFVARGGKGEPGEVAKQPPTTENGPQPGQRRPSVTLDTPAARGGLHVGDDVVLAEYDGDKPADNGTTYEGKVREVAPEGSGGFILCSWRDYTNQAHEAKFSVKTGVRYGDGKSGLAMRLTRRIFVHDPWAGDGAVTRGDDLPPEPTGEDLEHDDE